MKIGEERISICYEKDNSIIAMTQDEYKELQKEKFDLANEVNSLSAENRRLKETNKTLKHLIVNFAKVSQEVENCAATIKEFSDYIQIVKKHASYIETEKKDDKE